MYRLSRSLNTANLACPFPYFKTCGYATVAGIKNVGVIGMGLMGHGIAQVSAASDYNVIALEPQKEFFDKGIQRIDSSLSKLVSKDKITLDQKNSILSRINYTPDVSGLKDCDLVIEAIVEDEKVKKKLYADLGQITKPEAILASNTSSLPISMMAEASSRPSQVVGLHFFNPVQLMKLVEVVKTDATSADAFDKAMQFTKSIGKTPISCKDTPGFVVNRLLVPSMAQAMALFDRGDASVADIDTGMRLGAGHPMGPLHLSDYVGLDTCLFILQGWTEKYPNEPAYFIPECLKAKVKAGKLGRKTGEGFYKWEGDKVVGVSE